MDPIIRTCSLAAASLTLLAAPVALARTAPQSSLSRYVEGRVAETEGDAVQARNSYAFALATDAASPQVAMRAYRQAVRIGDRPLALRASRLLDASGTLSPDGALFLLADAVSRNDWRDAETRLTRIEEAGNFAFLAPVIRAWIALGKGDGNPLEILNQRTDGLSLAYARQNRPYLLVAARQFDGLDVALARTGLPADRLTALHIALASGLMSFGERSRARALLETSDPDMARARSLVDAGKSPDRPVLRPAQGVAQLYADIAADLLRDSVPEFALTMAQLAAFTDPGSDQARLVLARALAANSLYSEALAALPAGSALASIADNERFLTLITAKRYDEALVLTSAWVARPSASAPEIARYGDALSRLKRHREAAAAFRRAIAAYAQESQAPWSLWLALGRELDLAGDWPGARPALKKAVELAPDEPDALNYYGYTLLTSGEDNAEALRLIERASRARPLDAGITDSLGWAMFKTGKTEEAIALLERAVAGDPTIAEIGRHLGDAYWAAGRRVDARYAWNAALIQAEGDEAKEISARLLSGPPRAR